MEAPTREISEREPWLQFDTSMEAYPGLQWLVEVRSERCAVGVFQ
jgi:hypothetical protein